jgi:hypothetical protein
MARDPAEAERLAQALRANLRRRKAAAPSPEPSGAGAVELQSERDASPRESLENKRQT